MAASTRGPGPDREGGRVIAGKDCTKPGCQHWHHSSEALKYFFSELEKVTPENFKKEEFGYRLLGIDSIDELPINVETAVQVLNHNVEVFWRTWKILNALGSPTQYLSISSLLEAELSRREESLRTSPTSATATQPSGTG